MKLWIDADAAPRELKEIVFRAGRRLGFETVLVANQSPGIPAGYSRVRAIRVDHSADAADRYIAEHASAGDIVVTADIALAAELVPRSVSVIDPRGDEYTENDVGTRLSVRDAMEELRGAGLKTGGPPPYGAQAKQAFAATLDRILTRVLERKNDPAP